MTRRGTGTTMWLGEGKRLWWTHGGRQVCVYNSGVCGEVCVGGGTKWVIWIARVCGEVSVLCACWTHEVCGGGGGGWTCGYIELHKVGHSGYMYDTVWM